MRPADHAPDFRGLETPVALVDGAMMAANIARMQAHIDALGVAFRPHVKTTKCVKVARLQRRAGARGITVSTLREADQFFEAGFTDVLYAVGITPNKMAHVLALRERGCALKVIVDSVEAAHALVAAGRAAQHAFDALIEIDTDGQRAGVTPDSDLLLQIGRTLHDGGMHLAGVMTHAGGSYGLHTPAALAAFAEQERSRCVHAAGRLRAAGLPCPTVSVGSTPTALSATHLEGVTEVRAGVYVFNDLVMAGIGVCGVHDIALSVLGTVIGHQPEKGWTLIDAGWMALSRDRGRGPAGGPGLRPRLLRRRHADARLHRLGREPGARHRDAARRLDRHRRAPALPARQPAARAAQPRLRHRGAVQPIPRAAGRRSHRDLAALRRLVDRMRSG